jgi:hypothetical protein
MEGEANKTRRAEIKAHPAMDDALERVATSLSMIIVHLSVDTITVTIPWLDCHCESHNVSVVVLDSGPVAISSLPTTAGQRVKYTALRCSALSRSQRMQHSLPVPAAYAALSIS